MSNQYQSKRLADCQLPRDMFKRMSAMIEGYPRMKTEMAGLRLEILHATPRREEVHTGTHSTPGDPTANRAIRMARLCEELDCIERTIAEVNVLYTRKVKRDDLSAFAAAAAFIDYGYFCFALYDPDKNAQPARRTWSYFKTLLAFKLAQHLGLA